jgi:progesterone-induced-blocking factor 1
MQQSVRLAKRVLNLERINVDLNREIDLLKTSKANLESRLDAADSALDGVNQPYNYLVNSARDKDEVILKLKHKLKSQQGIITDQNDTVGQLKKVWASFREYF